MSSFIKIAMPLVDDRFGRPEAVPRFGSAPSALFEGVEMLPEGELEIHVISCVEKPVPAPERIGRNLYYHQAILPHWSYLRTLHSGPILAVNRILRKIRPDLVHAQGSERWAAWSALPFCGPKILTLHGFLRRINRVCPMEPRLYWKLQEWMETICLRFYDGVIAISKATERDLGSRMQKVWVLPNAVEASLFEVQRKVVQPPIFLNVGLICGNKNQLGVIRALKNVGDHSRFLLRLLGEKSAGWGDLSAFEEAAAVSWCEVPGKIGRAALREELGRAYALVHFSFEENCPMAVLEAMAAGVPVVASRVGAVPDWMVDGKNGLVVEPGDEAALARAVQFLLDNPDRAAEIGAEGRKTALALFHPKRIAEEHLKIYRELIDASSRKAKKRK